jgi:hypothetical protein
LRIGTAVIAAVGLSLGLSPSPASAASTSVTIDDPAPGLKERSGGGFTIALGFTNLTDRQLTLTSHPAAAAGRGCRLTLDKTPLPAAQHSAVTVIVPAACKVDQQQGIAFTVTAGGAEQPVSFAVAAAPRPAGEPDWQALWAFPIALGALAAAALVLLIAWEGGELKYLEATWSLKDSWASNVTVVAGLLTGVFGSSEVVKALLGEDGQRSVALATVGAAAAVAFIGAGPIVLLSTKTRNGAVTTAGLVFASAITLTGAYGELWTVYASGRRLDLGGWEGRLIYPTAAAGLLLAIYAFRSLAETIERGKTKPKTVASDTLVAARMIVTALKTDQDITETQAETALQQLDGQSADPDVGTSRGDDYPARRTAVL